ncbi:hypothetical protein LEP1GSC060_1388 [Leptospira weilii serovar Ranarum str. ICFT]|uniref:Uncharacterized protein n=1 Tax=Leptospira weilii serovar Ranarum str. ICFT TaxID=1218598 RepID=N1WQW8_9LEPT|nr:hypothetical protein LEP1GSC060_1388 [Leptospira weilii serovar Ranarum str. ICFT]
MKQFVRKRIVIFLTALELFSCKPEDRKFDALDPIAAEGSLCLFNLLVPQSRFSKSQIGTDQSSFGRLRT